MNGMGSWFGEDYRGAAGKVTTYVRCYESHKPMLMVSKTDGKTYEIHGGSCFYPTVKDADIYIGLDSGMKKGLALPWDGQIEYCYHINDMGTPGDAVLFKKLVTWVCNQLHLGKKIHAGCMGGHGRTGTLFAAVVAEFTGNDDATTYVRANYCDHAVESKSQVNWLHTHFGVKKVKGFKEYDSVSPKATGPGYYVDRGGLLPPKGQSTHVSQGDMYEDSMITKYDSKGNIMGFHKPKYERDKYASGGRWGDEKKVKIHPAKSGKNVWS